jgi:predicted acylesterase/phospholipase RssA
MTARLAFGRSHGSSALRQLFLRLLLLLWLLVTGAQESAGAQQAVALGGGGSRGLAHAGALLGLEQRGYRFDLVTGTSMGAIVGGLYAAGYQPSEIWRLIETVDWPAMFAAMPRVFGPERTVLYPMLELDARGGAAAATSGLITDWRINRLLVRLFLDADTRAGGDFDRLPRRYRAVTADVRTGEAVVLAEGPLARAVRASMSVPGVFSPVLWGDRLLVDGGIADYLPVLPARELGASYVVAVDVIRPSPRMEEDNPVSLGLRAFRLVLLNTLPEGVQPDLLLLPPIGAGFAEAAFPGDPRPLLEAGLEAGLAAPPSPVEPLATPPAALLPQGAPPRIVLDRLVIDGGDHASAVLARRAFDRRVPGAYDTAAVFKTLDRLYATGLYDGIWPYVRPSVGTSVSPAPDATLPDPPVAATLHLLLEPAPVSSLAGAAGYDNDRGWRGWAAARTRPRRGLMDMELAGLADGISRVGSVRFTRPVPVLLPLRGSFGAHVRDTEIRFFENHQLQEDLSIRVGRVGGWFGLEVPHLVPARLLSARLLVESIQTDSVAGRLSWGPELSWQALGPPVAIVGSPTVVSSDFRFGDLSYQRGRLAVHLDDDAGRWLWALGADATAVGGDAPLDVLPALGDDFAVPGLRRGELRGRSRLVAGVDVARSMPFEAHARLRLRAGAVGGELAELVDSSPWLAGVELASVWATPLGSAVIGAGFATRGYRRLIINVGGNF